ncbi:hypothetical protein HELRODRAFT_182296 [Helobdella robusta]|uniref:Uncharacterized protein n=1 Tax=Helobdella robusta TaxID=6412 RepID=T1FI10_HELRO|nr:hypothetical protein HELRODRAFT_182296 [Helobdella robusta]ESN91054.1 hypothetical protein HELRODRAFT_182296 [Helobdella robusta]
MVKLRYIICYLDKFGKYDDEDDDECFENSPEVDSDKDIETFDMQWDFYSDLTANLLVFIDNNDISSNNSDDFDATLTNYSIYDKLDKTLIWGSINLEINGVSEEDSNANANIYSGHQSVTDDNSSFGKTLPALRKNTITSKCNLLNLDHSGLKLYLLKKTDRRFKSKDLVGLVVQFTAQNKTMPGKTPKELKRSVQDRWNLKH